MRLSLLTGGPGTLPDDKPVEMPGGIRVPDCPGAASAHQLGVAGVNRCCTFATSEVAATLRGAPHDEVVTGCNDFVYACSKELWHGPGSELALVRRRGREASFDASLRHRKRQLRASVSGGLMGLQVIRGERRGAHVRRAPQDHESVGALLQDRCVASPLPAVRLARLPSLSCTSSGPQRWADPSPAPLLPCGAPTRFGSYRALEVGPIRGNTASRVSSTRVSEGGGHVREAA